MVTHVPTRGPKSKNEAAEGAQPLRDPFGRTITYLRLSVTDRCNFRCQYCMAEDMEFLPKSALLSFEEIVDIVSAFAELGLTKVRLTGGEPLIRRDVVELVSSLKTIDGIKEVAMTTNGARLPHFATDLMSAGLDRINISLDTLDPKKFREITRTGDLYAVLDGIKAAQDAGFERIKINAVILAGKNANEVDDLIDFILSNQLDISFIEEMPLGEISSHRRSQTFFSSDDIKAQIAKRFSLVASDYQTGGPSRYFTVDGFPSKIGFISPHSHNFCAACNRVRMTAEGLLLLCLGNEDASSLRDFIRTHRGDRRALKAHLRQVMRLKPKAHDFDVKDDVHIIRFMNMTGG